jgi:hypothetical protein
MNYPGYVPQQCCQKVYFQTKNPNLGKFWKVLQGKMLVFLCPFSLFYGHLVHLVVIWYIFARFGMLYREKSGNPVPQSAPAPGNL